MNKSLYSFDEIEAWKFLTSLLNYDCIEQIANRITSCETRGMTVSKVEMMVNGQEIVWYTDEDVFTVNGFGVEDLTFDRRQLRRLRKAVRVFRSKEI